MYYIETLLAKAFYRHNIFIDSTILVFIPILLFRVINNPPATGNTLLCVEDTKDITLHVMPRRHFFNVF